MSHFYLYGPSGAGKSTIGRLLAERLALPFHDLDVTIEAAAGAAIPEIFARLGEAEFRVMESAELTRLARLAEPAVIALGGGALLEPASMRLAAETGRTLCLRADPDTLLARLDRNAGRPLLAGDGPAASAANLAAYLGERATHYDSFALQLDTTGLSPAEAAAAAGRSFGAFRVDGMGRPYDVRLEAGLLDRIPKLLEERGLAGPYALVADSNTAIYAHRLADALAAAGLAAAVVVLEAGEAHKTIQTIQTLWSAFLDAGLDRRSTVLAVGGGVVCDLAGFAAATFLRGVSWVAVPTSLLAMVDASLGGKTGVDLPQGKNLAGAFHPPRLVAADPLVLDTLPEREIRNGMAEVVKAGVIGDPELFDRCAAWSGGAPPADWIARAVDVKVRIIRGDPFEGGEREQLNFGHTIGHAVEHASGYRLAHGEAVAIGMVAETRISESLGISERGLSARIAGCLEAIGLPVDIPAGLDPDAVADAAQVDKKRLGGKFRFALPVRIGEVGVVEVAAEQFNKHIQL